MIKIVLTGLNFQFIWLQVHLGLHRVSIITVLGVKIRDILAANDGTRSW